MTITTGSSSSLEHPSPSSSPSSSMPSCNVTSAEEMQELLGKLKELVPNMPRHKKLSKLEIIQYVIDYIFDLQTALESHPANSSLVNSLQAISPRNTNFRPVNTSSPPSQLQVTPSSSHPETHRQPLSTISSSFIPTGEAVI